MGAAYFSILAVQATAALVLLRFFRRRQRRIRLERLTRSLRFAIRKMDTPDAFALAEAL